MKFAYLNIPPVPNHIQERLLSIGEQLPNDMDTVRRLQQWYGDSIRVASHVYGRKNAVLPLELQIELNKMFAPYFGTNFTAILGKIKNTHTDGLPACTPPHCDRVRRIAVNYLLLAGGSNVETVLYKTGRTDPDLSNAQDARYEELEIDYRVQIPVETWHAYNVQYYHSVENVETTRLLLSLVLDNDTKRSLTFDKFVIKYKNLINI
jgi:hypothetical protein